MSILSNSKHERFAQELAQGKSASEAYVAAGFAANTSNAARLNGNERVRVRVEELLHVGAEKAGVTIQRIVEELAKIGFSDIRKVVKWHGELVQESDNPDGGEVLVIKNIVTNHVQLVSSGDIDDETAAALSEVSQTKEGLKVKMHSKLDALEKLGKHLGMFKEKVEVSGAVVNKIEWNVVDPETEDSESVSPASPAEAV